jgi:S-adenosylmethionine hydrolase
MAAAGNLSEQPHSRMDAPLLVFTTDFGTADPYAGIMRGVVLGINPRARLMDLTHQISPQNVAQASFVLGNSYRYFPPEAIHVVVVDPGVGTGRRPVLVSTPHGRFVGPDNGVLSQVLSGLMDDAPRAPGAPGTASLPAEVTAVHLTNSAFWRLPVSHTFHGRDIFAPIAAWLSRGVETSKFGDYVSDYVRFQPPKPKALNERLIKGVVLKVDKFGNVITNFTPEDLPMLFQQSPPPFKFVAGKSEITKLNLTYAQSAPGDLFAIVGSTGYLELATSRGAAAKILGIDKGADVGVVLG